MVFVRWARGWIWMLRHFGLIRTVRYAWWGHLYGWWPEHRVRYFERLLRVAADSAVANDGPRTGRG